ncbi:MAG: flagellar biosynthesis protein FlhB [candidate division Zixibacteria bacterium]|nr:flagellar biosynthesis protein FlhB [candidate division Zixibacteria bacterium]
MAEQSSQDEKTEQPTPKKRDDARKEGQVCKSQELNSVFIILTGIMALMFFHNHLLTGWMGAFSFNLGQIGVDITPTKFYELFLTNGKTLITLVAPIILLLGLVALLINMAQVGIGISPKALKPKFDKLDIFKGLKNLFSMKTVFNLFRDTTKIAIVGYVTYLTYKGEVDNYIPLADQEIGQVIIFIARVAVKIFLRSAGVLLLLAILDYAYQKYEFEKKLKMTKQEVKDEMKHHEGDPLVKMRIKRIQREMARARMLQEVEKADVVVTNPTHIAVALKYDLETMPAPTVVAKGERLMAERIKELAKKAGVPIVENKPLARTLFKSVEVGMEIPAKLFKAVAEVLAYVYKLKGNI